MKSALTADRVRDFFSDIGVVVCDNQALIDEHVKRRRQYYLRHGQSADPHKRTSAEDWMKMADTATRNLPKLLDPVYMDFRDLAEASLVSRGCKRIDSSLTAYLNKQALRKCLWDESRLHRPDSTTLYDGWIKRLQSPPPEGVDLSHSLSNGAGRRTALIGISGVAAIVIAVGVYVSNQTASEAEARKVLMQAQARSKNLMLDVSSAESVAKEARALADQTVIAVAQQQSATATAAVPESARHAAVEKLASLHRQSLEAKNSAEDAAREALGARISARAGSEAKDVSTAAGKAAEAGARILAANSSAQKAINMAREVRHDAEEVGLELEATATAEKQRLAQEFAAALQGANTVSLATHEASVGALSTREEMEPINKRIASVARQAREANLREDDRPQVESSLKDIRSKLLDCRQVANKAVDSASKAKVLVARAIRSESPDIVREETESAQLATQESVQLTREANLMAKDISEQIDRLEVDVHVRQSIATAAKEQEEKEPMLGQLTRLRVQTSPSRSTVIVDGKTVFRWPYAAKPGRKIEIEVRKEGYVSQKSIVQLSPGDDRTVSFELQSKPRPPKPSPIRTQQASRSTRATGPRDAPPIIGF